MATQDASKIRAFALKDLPKLIMILLAVTFICLLFPGNQIKNSNIRVGETWTLPDVEAASSFVIGLSDREVTQKRAELQSSFSRIYRKSDFNIASAIDDLLKVKPDLIPQKEVITSAFEEVYEYPVVDFKEDNTSVLLLNKGMETRLKANELKTRNEAFDALVKDLYAKNIFFTQEDARNALEAHVQVSATLDNAMRNKMIEQTLEELTKDNVSVRKGETIIKTGERLTALKKQQLDTHFRSSVIKPFTFDNVLAFLGYFLLTALIIGVLILYSLRSFPKLTETAKGISFLLFWPVLFALLVYLVERSGTISPYMIPFCITPIVVSNFFGVRLALFVHIVVILIASFLSSLGYEFTFLQILAGIVTVLVIVETRYWNKFFQAIVIILASYLVGYLGLALINSGSLNNNELPVFGWLVVNALLLLLAYPFIPLVERMFGFVSSITLAELGDMNKPLLKELSIKAPGTMQHSLQVANLSEAAADKIGANSLLVKVAALYHDIGKTIHPQYFIENNPKKDGHNGLSNFESAKVIIDHVIEGEKMAKKAKLPQIIIDFITTHHGTTRVEYFYRNQIKSEPDREFDETLFQYPGPKPRTKEETIMMLADSIEAASKSLDNPTGQAIDELIKKIVEYKIGEGQLYDSELTFNELEECINVFSALLRSIYHVRIEYPE